MLMLYAAVIDDAEDIKRFERLYYGYRKQMLFVANELLHDTHEAEDAVQNALLGIARSMKSLPDGDERLVRAYVLTAAKNAALNLLPKKQRRDSELDIDTLELADGEDIFKKLAASDDREKLMRAMDKLRIYIAMFCCCTVFTGLRQAGPRSFWAERPRPLINR